MKKIITIVLAMVAAIGLLSGCSSSSNKQTSKSKKKTITTAANKTIKNNKSSSDNTSSGNKKTLVVYYSATGTTKNVAEMIADEADADLFEIQPKDPYTDEDLDWTNDDSRVSKEHDNEDQRNVELKTTKVKNWDSYDNVLIGYPIWWGIAAWPVDNFVKDNDFSNKTVIPFCTSASSGLGDSGNLLEKMAGTGTWKDGEGFDSSTSQKDIQNWIKSLNLK